MEWLRVREDGVYVDCTAGSGGHSERIAQVLRNGRLIALDCDPSSVEIAKRRLSVFSNVTVVHRNYGELAEVLETCGAGRVDGVLIDAGVSSMQLDDPARGFSFQEKGPLDMRMDATQGISAAEYLATIRESDLTQVLRAYGDVGPARRVARSIIQRRKARRLKTTRDLAEAVGEALPFVQGMPDETRTVFQAIRVAVNDEFRQLEAGVLQAVEALAPGGRLVVITFHSGEDRIAKNVLRDASHERRECFPDGRLRERIPPRLRLLTARPVQPGAAERQANPRSHSAKLRAAERL